MEYSSAGIYVDGGKDIVIEHNETYSNDLGIEIASEHKGKGTSNVELRHNTIHDNFMYGIALGGYDEDRGFTEGCIMVDNLIYNNDVNGEGFGQVAFQYDTRNNTFARNTVIASESQILITNPYVENQGNRLNENSYQTIAGEGIWEWRQQYYENFEAYQTMALTEYNEADSTFAVKVD